MVTLPWPSQRGYQSREHMLVYRFSWPQGYETSKHDTSVALRFVALADFVCLSCSPRQLTYDNMPNDEAIHVGLSSATLLSAGFMLRAASMQDTKRHHSLQLCVCSAFLPLTVALVILSALRLNGMSGEIDLI